MKIALKVIAVITVIILGYWGYQKFQEKPLETVEEVDLNMYLGKWYEIASFPQRFQKGCVCTTAEYSFNSEGYIDVKNTCLVDGELENATGKAFVTDKKTNAKLQVQFFWPFKGKYWIIALAKDYSYAVVGHPNRKYLWILSRRKQMNEETYRNLLTLVEKKGFDIRKLNKTYQDCDR